MKDGAELACRRLALQAIHEDAQSYIKGIGLLSSWSAAEPIRGSNTGNCKADLARINEEAGLIRKNRPDNMGMKERMYKEAQLSINLTGYIIRVMEAPL